MQSQELLNKLREMYSKGQFDLMVKTYSMGAWMLEKKDREKIERVIKKLKEPNSLIKYAINEMGCKLDNN